MTQNEFEQRTNMKVTAEEYQKIEKLYMSAGNIDKDTFCKEYKKVASSRIVTELHLQVRMLENQVESLKSDKKQMASDKDELIDFMIEQSEKYGSSELRQRAIELLGAKELSTMATFHKVVTRITDRRNTIVYAGEVQADKRPKNTCEETRMADIYEDYFDTYEEAQLFIRTQKKDL